MVHIVTTKTTQTMRVRLKLKDHYEWPSLNPEKPNKNNIGFVQTDLHLPIGTAVTFEELNAKSMAGDLNEDHYKYFSGKVFVSARPPFPAIEVELMEV